MAAIAAATPAGSTTRTTAEARRIPIGPRRTNMEAQPEETHCKAGRTMPGRTKLARAPANVMSPIAAARVVLAVAAEQAVLAERAVLVEWVVQAVAAVQAVLAAWVVPAARVVQAVAAVRAVLAARVAPAIAAVVIAWATKAFPATPRVLQIKAHLAAAA